MRSIGGDDATYGTPTKGTEKYWEESCQGKECVEEPNKADKEFNTHNKTWQDQPK